jgi:hypothetical protein
LTHRDESVTFSSGDDPLWTKLHKLVLQIMKQTTKIAAFAALSLGVAQGALVTEYINGGVGSSNSANGVHTLGDDTAAGDFWNGGDTGTYLHESERVTGSFSAVVRVVGQSEAASGRWGKAGIMARDSLLPGSSSGMAQLASGNGSQPGGNNPVPVRLAGRTLNDGNGGFEIPVNNADGEIANDVFLADGGVNVSWLRLDYNASTNAFTSGFAADVDGAAGAWAFSDAKSDVIDTNSADGWYVGMAYSAHSDMGIAAGEGIHTVSFDNFSISSQIPEPSTSLLGLGGLLFLAIRRKR